MLPLSACVTDPETGQRSISKAAIGGVGGALGGYLLGDLIGGRRDRTEKIVGAGIGAIAGAGVGYYMDEQERKLRQQTAGTGVNVIRDGDNLVLDMPSEVTFAVDSANIDPAFRATLDQVATTLVQYEKTYVDVLGHTIRPGPTPITRRCPNAVHLRLLAISLRAGFSRHGLQRAAMARASPRRATSTKPAARPTGALKSGWCR
jgi:hypothetical protein